MAKTQKQATSEEKNKVLNNTQKKTSSNQKNGTKSSKKNAAPSNKKSYSSKKYSSAKTYSKKTTTKKWLFFYIDSGGDLLSRAVSSQVPSALKGLTSVFGMGTGDPFRHYHRKF